MVAPLNAIFSDEILSRVLNFLGPVDLIRLQLVNSHFNRLASDPFLWKRLFYFTFVQPSIRTPHARRSGHAPLPLPTLAGLSSLLLHQNLDRTKPASRDGRQIARLPSRFHASSRIASSSEEAMRLSHLTADNEPNSLFDNLNEENHPRNDGLDWMALFKVSFNWQRGNFLVSELVESREHPVTSLRKSSVSPEPSEASSSRGSKQTPDDHWQDDSRPRTIVEASANLIFTASRSTGNRDHTQRRASLPTVQVYLSTQRGSSRGPHRRKPHDPTQRRPIGVLQSNRVLAELEQRSVDLDKVSITDVRVDASHLGMDLVHSGSLQPTRGRKRKAQVETDSLDQASRGVKVFACYSTGHIAIFCVCAVQSAKGYHLEAEEEAYLRPTPETRSTAASAFHFPLLVTCSEDFTISVYRLGSSKDAQSAIELIQRMTSYRCWWPACIRLKPLPYYDAQKRQRQAETDSGEGEIGRRPRSGSKDHDKIAFRLTIAYSTPAYPASWSVGLQEVVIQLDNSREEQKKPPRITSRHATAKHISSRTPIDPRGSGIFLNRPEGIGYRTLPWYRPGGSGTKGLSQSDRSTLVRNRVTSITYDDPFIVLGAQDNLLEVFELFGATTHLRHDHQEDEEHALLRPATATPTSSKESLRLIHRRVLYGHTGSVQSVALEDGRCVSGSADGSVMVWNLGERINETDSVASLVRRARGGSVRQSRPRRRTSTEGSGRSLSGSRAIPTDEGSSVYDPDLEDSGRSMTHVVTLRAHEPMPFETLYEESGEESDEEHNDRNDEDGEVEDTRSTESTEARSSGVSRARLGPTLGQLLEQAKDNGSRTSSPDVIRWVSTAFDKIVSVIGRTGSHVANSRVAGTAQATSSWKEPENNRAVDGSRQERVQIWDFTR